MPITTAFIPAELRSKLAQIEPALIERGVVQPHHGHGRHTFRLRYRELDANTGCRVHRSLALGRDPALAQAVAEHLVLLREKAAENRLILDTEAACERAAARAEREKARRQARLERDHSQSEKPQPKDPRDELATMLSLLCQLTLATEPGARPECQVGAPTQ